MRGSYDVDASPVSPFAFFFLNTSLKFNSNFSLSYKLSCNFLFFLLSVFQKVAADKVSIIAYTHNTMRMLDHNKDPLCRDSGFTVGTSLMQVKVEGSKWRVRQEGKQHFLLYAVQARSNFDWSKERGVCSTWIKEARGDWLFEKRKERRTAGVT